MKIIQRGPKPVDKVARFQCHECKSVLEAPMSEGRFAPGMMGVGNYYCFTCPVCNATTCPKESLFSDPNASY